MPDNEAHSAVGTAKTAATKQQGGPSKNGHMRDYATTARSANEGKSPETQ